MIGLLFAVTFAGAPFLSARAALYPEILPGPMFVLGQAVSMTTIQVAQVAALPTLSNNGILPELHPYAIL